MPNTAANTTKSAAIRSKLYNLVLRVGMCSYSIAPSGTIEVMKRLRLDHILAWLLLVILGLIVVHAPLTVFIESRWPGVGDAAKAWKELLLLTALLLLCVKITLSKVWGKLLQDKLLWLIGGYAVLHIVMVLAGHTTTMAAVAGLMIDLRYVAYFVAVYVFLRLCPNYIQSFYRVVLVGAVIVLGFALLQQVLPRDFLKYAGYSESTIKPYLTVDENPDYVRHSSTLRGPNPLGAYAVMALAGVVAYGMAVGRKVKDAKVKYLHLLLAIGALVALWSSHSRSAWIAAVAAVVLLAAVRYRKVLSGKVAAWLVLAAVVVAAGVYAIKDTSFFHNVVLHDNPTTGADIDSNSGHLESLIDGTAKMLASPLGSGVGSTGSASLYGDAPVIIENQYLFTAHEVGWLGLGLFVVIFTIIMIRLWKLRQSWKALAVFASGAGLAVIGLLLPVWADDTVSIIWWGLAAVVLAEGGIRGKTTNQKAKRTT